LKALVTGASSGIGRELVKLLCSEKDNTVIGVARSEKALMELKEGFKECFIPVPADLSRMSGVDTVVREVREKLGELDLLVNNAGFGLYKKILEHTDEELLSMTMVNFITPILLTKKLLNIMKPGSTVVYVITAGVYVLLDDLPVYGATKTALHYAVNIIRRELEEKGIHVLTVYPGAVVTPFHEKAGYKIEKGVKPEEVARAILEGVKKKKKEVYTPAYLSIAKILTPLMIHVKGPIQTRKQ